MLELGEPLHAFDYDVLRERAEGKRIKISTRAARDGEVLETLDGVQRKLSALNVLVCDEAGPLSIAGVMGGADSEVTESTQNVLLEGAAWNFINIRRTAKEHDLPSEASFRFSRGVHPALAHTGVQLGLQYMSRWSGGSVAPGLVDEFRLKPKTATVTFTTAEVKRALGIDVKPKEIVRRLRALDFKCSLKVPPPPKPGAAKKAKSREPAASRETQITVTAPPHRLDIGEGVIGLADVMEEIARMVGYDRIPSTNMADALPPQLGNATHEWEERLRDLLAALGLDEVVSYRLTSAAREDLLGVTNDRLRIANPVAPDKSALRTSLLASVLEDVERNVRWSESLAFFEVGPVFEPRDDDLPREPRRLAIAMTGFRHPAAWDQQETQKYDYYDLKGRLELLMNGLHFTEVEFKPTSAVPYLNPGKAAEIHVHGRTAGVLGELHPVIKARYEFGQPAVLAAELDLDLLRGMVPAHQIAPVADFPPVLEDIAIIVAESIPASQVEGLIRETGGAALAKVQLFDIYRGEQIGAGKKSLAYSLTYQSPERTLTDAEAAAIRNRVVKRLEQGLGATLRG
jgi:phenylalanyl-tRNA synthetase beta chain